MVRPTPEFDTPQNLDELMRLELGGMPGFRDENPSPYRVSDPNAELYGLALSGGGIRSATFNLGLLQGLHGLGLLNGFHYLSTVSGGGYVGAFWSAWRSRPENAGKTFPEGTRKPGCPEPREIRHLREFSNFLAPRMGVLGWDTGRLVVTVLSSIIPSLLAAASVLLLAVLTWCGIVYWLFAVPAQRTAIQSLSISALVMGVVTLALLMGSESLWRKRKEKTSERAHLVGMLIAVVTTVTVWVWMAGAWKPFATAFEAGQQLPIIRNDQTVFDWEYLLLPSAAWGVTVLAFVAMRWFTSSMVDAHKLRMARSAHDRVQSRVLLMAATWAAMVLLWCVGVWVYARMQEARSPALGTGLASLSALGTAVFAWVQKRLTLDRGKPVGRVKALLKVHLPQVLAYAILAAMSVCTVALLAAAEATWYGLELPAGIPGGVPVAVVLGAAAAVGAVLWFLNPNEVGLHAFYRGRLARTYPGASAHTGERKTEEQETDDMPLQFLSHETPCHLICCAANDLADGGDLSTLHRGAESAVLSRVAFSVAEEWAAWQPGRDVPTLAGAITASGAAFNSLMGSRSIKYGPAVTFLMAAFNLRLGLWWPHPRRSPEQSLAERTLVGLPFFNEMFGRARSRGRDVHLSDGAHFENLAIYELIRRHCRVIVASDCGMDPTVAFEDFGNLVRRVREDFGVDIRIDLSPLCPDGITGLARQPMVAGDIHYPEGDTGILLLFKPTLVGNEPADIAQYRRRNVLFPHESTGDQFYDEAQWESYRRLGEHAAVSAFERLTVGLKPVIGDPRAADGFAAQVFNRARREWLPIPSGFADRVSHLADRMVQLDELLRGEHCDTLLREVYKEVDELDRWAKNHSGPTVPVGRIVAEDGTAIEPRAPRDGVGDSPEPGAAAGAVTRADDPGAADAMSAPRGEAAMDVALGGETDPAVEAGTQGAVAAANPQPDAAAAQRLVAGECAFPNGQNLSSSLHLIRRALLVFEEAYEREDLGRNVHHPVYLGLMNYMARWAYAPLFRMWWPLLKTLYPQPFTRFMETHFGLAEIGMPGEAQEHVEGVLSREQVGFAMDAWTLQGGRKPEDGEGVRSYLLSMRYRDFKPPYQVQAAQAIVREVGETLVWDADDFFVPPGLWGVGIGEGFLRQLRDHSGVSQLVVRLRVDESPTTESGEEMADTLQLYRSAGFERIQEIDLSPDIRNALAPGGGFVRAKAAGVGTERIRWMRLQAKPAAR
jgi:hypothetical protein